MVNNLLHKDVTNLRTNFRLNESNIMKLYEYQSFQESDKKVLMFYHLWHGCFTESAVNIDIHAPRNITRTIKENRDALNNEDILGPYISYHYWGEPLFGYYDLAKDEYVIESMHKSNRWQRGRHYDGYSITWEVMEKPIQK